MFTSWGTVSDDIRLEAFERLSERFGFCFSGTGDWIKAFALSCAPALGFLNGTGFGFVALLKK